HRHREQAPSHSLNAFCLGDWVGLDDRSHALRGNAASDALRLAFSAIESPTFDRIQHVRLGRLSGRLFLIVILI
ncbi:hypothetical protein, partial [Pseudomonas kitaguniensis]|uniref:hypothetical protein n=1 Tax=Pseudomonas kitaguniensis TaxID=2607908 RepID=UPI003D083D98